MRVSIIFSFLLTLAALPAQAQEAPASYPVPPPDLVQTVGQNQYYSIVFDGEGEAAVAAKLTFQNITQDTISSVEIEIPGSSVRLISAIQEKQRLTPPCLRYSYPPGYQGQESGEILNYPCLQYDYGYYGPLYFVLTPTEEHLSESTKVTFLLLSPALPKEQFEILLYFKAQGYAEKQFGIFRFNFQTIKMPYDVQSVRVAINVQEGLYLSGGAAKTEYQPDFAAVESAPALPREGAESAALQDFSQSIIYEPGFVKETQGLDPWESFSVKGKYASSRLLLAMPKLLAAFVILLITGSALFVGGIKLRTFAAKKSEHSVISLWIQASIAGFIVAFITAVSFGIIQWTQSYLLQYAGYGQFSQLFSLLLALSLIGFNLLMFLGVPVYFWRRYSLSIGLLTLAVELGALFLISFAALLVLRPSSPEIFPVPLRDVSSPPYEGIQ